MVSTFSIRTIRKMSDDCQEYFPGLPRTKVIL